MKFYILNKIENKTGLVSYFNVSMATEIETLKSFMNDLLNKEDMELDKCLIKLEKSIIARYDALNKLDQMETKYSNLFESSKLKRESIQGKKKIIEHKTELDNKLKAEKMEKQKEVEKLKKATTESSICQLFRFTPSDIGTNNYVSKKVICDLLGLDYMNQKDIRLLSNILKKYGVVYDRFKTINKVKGCFQYIELK